MAGQFFRFFCREADLNIRAVGVLNVESYFVRFAYHECCLIIYFPLRFGYLIISGFIALIKRSDDEIALVVFQY